MKYLDAYNMPIGTIFYHGYGREMKEYHLEKKSRKAFGELRMILVNNQRFDPGYLTWDEYDFDEYFDSMRLKV